MTTTTSSYLNPKYLNPAIVLVIVSILIYAKTAGFEFVLDDKIVITGNQITKKGLKGIGEQFKYDSMDGFWAEQYGVDVADLNKDALVAGGRYRPLTLSIHSIEYALFKESPGMYHVINILSYALTILVLYAFLCRILVDNKKKKWWLTTPFLITLLYATHPLHVEVVANIKSLDEILSFLFGVLALDYSVRYIQSQNNKFLIYLGVFFGLSLLSKETTISFIALIPLVLYFFTDSKLKDLVKPTATVFVVGLIYFVIRSSVVGESSISNELMNNPFVNATFTQKLGVVFLTLTAYFKLLFIPHPLTHDYYPFHLPFMEDLEQYPEITHPASLIGIALTFGLLYIAFIGLFKKSIYSFSILLFFGTFVLVSNLFFPVGVFMNERFMYIPSIGFAIAIVYLITEVLPNKVKGISTQNASIFLLVMAGIFAIISVKRSNAWENDEVLALTDVQTSLGSAKARMAAGDALLREIEKEKNPQVRNQMINEAFGHLKRSLEIHPSFFPPNDLLGKLYYEAKNYDESIRSYARCYQIKQDNKFIKNINFVVTKLIEQKKYENAIRGYQTSLQLNPNYYFTYKALGELYGNQIGQPKEAEKYLEKANSLKPNDAEIIEKLGICKAMLGQSQQAITLFNNALKLNPNNANLLNNLAVLYKQIGNDAMAEQYISKSQRLKGGSK